MRPLISRSKLNAQSEKAKAKNAARVHCCRVTLARANYRCEAAIPGVCSGRATDTHERKSRAQGGDPTDPANTLALCRDCHKHVHSNPAEAFDLGLLDSAKLEAQRG